MNNPKNIAHILTPIEFGGLERVALNFIKNVDKSRYHVTPILLVRPWEKDNVFMKYLTDEGIEYKLIPVAIKPREEGRDYFRVLRCFREIYSLLDGGSYELVHTHGYFADIIGLPVARYLGIPTVSTCHGYIRNDNKLKIYNLLDIITLRLSNRIIAVSESIKLELCRKGIKEDKVVVISNAIQCEHPTNREETRKIQRGVIGVHEDEFLIGYVGRLSEEKGVKYLIEAQATLHNHDVRLKTVIIGDGPKREELMEMVDACKLNQQVFFLGFQDKLEKWFPAIDLFVLPSLTEGTPMSLLEAMSYGIPVVATAVGGVPQIITSGENGILIPPGSVESLKRAIVSLYKDRELRWNISNNAYISVNMNYSLRNWLLNIYSEYENVVN